MRLQRLREVNSDFWMSSKENCHNSHVHTSVRSRTARKMTIDRITSAPKIHPHDWLLKMSKMFTPKKHFFAVREKNLGNSEAGFHCGSSDGGGTSLSLRYSGGIEESSKGNQGWMRSNCVQGVWGRKIQQSIDPKIQIQKQRSACVNPHESLFSCPKTRDGKDADT